MPLCSEVDLGPGRIVLDWDPTPRKGLSSLSVLSFRPMPIVAKRSPISATAEHLLNHAGNCQKNVSDHEHCQVTSSRSSGQPQRRLDDRRSNVGGEVTNS